MGVDTSRVDFLGAAFLALVVGVFLETFFFEAVFGFFAAAFGFFAAAFGFFTAAFGFFPPGFGASLWSHHAEQGTDFFPPGFGASSWPNHGGQWQGFGFLTATDVNAMPTERWKCEVVFFQDSFTPFLPRDSLRSVPALPVAK